MDILAEGEGLSVGGLRGARRSQACMHPHRGQVGAERAFESIPQRRRQRLAGATGGPF